ncbi:MAG: FIG00545237: hypothetical protein [uncultured Sulfurovum sp.]|uniref:Uncharacterized protein n=1 Tax=uncultured Sulfurovum sp. TaxID=269237 RepID=A0A6S6TW44_9BACT|nr:MAG: FIG00545237: hypothetical protein [uncultured Sulfurovum sp.]
MSWYRLVFVIVMYISFSHAHGVLKAKELMSVSDDELIITGLLYDEYRAYENARQVYARLFDTTHAEVYLYKEAKASLLGKSHVNESLERLKTWDKEHPTLESKRLLIPLYLTVNKVELAQTEAEYLLEHSAEAMDLELASNPFLYAGDFTRALSLLSKVYEQTLNEVILLRMTEIMDIYTEERKRAITLLESHRRMHAFSTNILAKLVTLYSKEKDVDGLMQTYTALYLEYKDEKILEKVIDTYAYKNDLTGAIAFLEEHKVGDHILYELYKSKRYFDKAIKLIDRKYSEDNDARWLAEKGMLIFEKADDKDDKEMLALVVSNFEKATSMGVDDSIYLNYYGYTLIDKEVDIKKGMQIIKDALVQQPDNTYYLDSLAWGHYKINECGKAYALMKRVVEEEGLEEEEIVTHWNAIQKCK